MDPATSGDKELPIASRPIPVIEYGTGAPNRYGRPKRLAVIGVLGMLFGILNVVGNAISGYTFWTLLPHAVVPPPPIRPPTPLPMPAHLAPLAGEVVGELGLPSNVRRRMIDYLTRARGLPQSHVFALNAILAERGKEIIANLQPDVGDDAIARLVERAELQARGVDSQTHVPFQNQFLLVTAKGTVRVEPFGARFTPVGGRVPDSSRVWCANPDWTYFVDENNHSLTAVVTLERLIHGTGHISMTPLQAAALVKELRRTDLPTEPLTMSPLRKIGTAGTIALTTNGNGRYWVLWVDSKGRSTWNPAPNLDPNTFTPIAPPPAPRPAGVTRPELYLMLGVTGVLTLMSLALLYFSNQVLLSAPNSRRNMLAYSWADIALSAAASALGIYWAQDLAASLSLPVPSQAEVIASHVGTAIGACIFPAVVLIVLYTPRALAYYRSLADEAATSAAAHSAQ